jgi:hypothetical protein
VLTASENKTARVWNIAAAGEVSPSLTRSEATLGEFCQDSRRVQPHLRFRVRQTLRARQNSVTATKFDTSPHRLVTHRQTTVRRQVVGRAVQERQVTTVYLAPRFAAVIRMPDAVNSVVVGDPDSFSAEHSEKESCSPVVKFACQRSLIMTD